MAASFDLYLDFRSEQQVLVIVGDEESADEERRLEALVLLQHAKVLLVVLLSGYRQCAVDLDDEWHDQLQHFKVLVPL